MGIITGLLVASGHLQKFEVPLWVILISPRGDRARHAVRRLAHREDDGHARSPSCSRSAASAPRPRARSPSSAPPSSGIPVSTTHTITGAIVGVGATKRLSAVKWGVAGRIVWAWVLTIPLAAAMSAISYFFLRRFF